MQTLVNRLGWVLAACISLAVIAALAGIVRGGPLDPPAAPSSTDSIRLPGTPISTAPYTISAPGHYYLTRSLSVAGNVIAVTITADNVSFDLGGFTIGGSDTVGSWGIYLAGTRSDVNVTNGTVRDFQFGLDAGDDTRVHVDGLRAVSNVRGIQIGHDSLVENCISSGNGETGIYVPGDRSLVDGCLVESNGGDGISVAGHLDSVVNSHAVNNSPGQLFSADIRDAPAANPGLNAYRANYVIYLMLTVSGGAEVIDNECGQIINTTGNFVGTPDHANTC